MHIYILQTENKEPT